MNNKIPKKHLLQCTYTHLKLIDKASFRIKVIKNESQEQKWRRQGRIK